MGRISNLNRNRFPSFEVVEDSKDLLLIRDVGPWDERLTVTNGAEEVVEFLALILHGRRLEYIDSDGERSELLVKDGKFAGFGPARKEVTDETNKT